MDLWLTVLLAVLGAMLLFAALAWWFWRRTTGQARTLMERVGRLSFRDKVQLAGEVMRDGRIPAGVRLVVPALVLYLCLPIDLVPDFIPILGQVDDIVMIVVGVSMLTRYAPRGLIEEHLGRLEPASPPPV
jgi:uncharacterized membrane protein YkvA (DUF1232 family)